MDERRKMIDLDDFGKLKDINILKSKKNQDEITPKEVEEFYQEKILELEQNFKNIIEKTKDEYYKKGFLEASKIKDKEYLKKIEEIKKEFLQEREKDLENLSKRYQFIEKEIREKLENYLNSLSNILLDNLEEILEYLYIQKSNSEIIKEAIFQIIAEFKENLPLEIKVSSSIFEEIKKSFPSIKIEKDTKLKEGDFIIEFYDFKLENRLKEKIEVLKDEIKRETKKFT